MKPWICTALLVWLLSSCQAVKPYQRAYLNDGLMTGETLPGSEFEQGVFLYREGALISGGKSGRGGCGCN